MTKEAFMKGATGNPVPVEINKGLVLERNTKRVTNLSKNEKIYAQGDGIMKIAPFDNYYLFTIYSELNLEDVPVDIHNMGSFFLTFKDKSSEVRIENFKNTKDVNASDGQILFRISQEDAEKILDLDTNIFYITSMLYDENSKSDETVLYSGRFAEYNDANLTHLSDEIEQLKSEIDKITAEKVKEVSELQKENNNLSDLINKLNVQYEAVKEDLKTYKNAYAQLCEQTQNYQNEVEERINQLQQETVEKELKEREAVNNAKKNAANRLLLDTGVKVLRQNILNINTETTKYEKSKKVKKEEINTVSEERKKIANVIVPKGIVTIYAFMHTTYASLDTEDEKAIYNNTNNIFVLLKDEINENKYNNIEFEIVYSEKDPGKIMSKYNINSDCVVITKDEKFIDSINIDYSKLGEPLYLNTILTNINNILESNI